MCGSEGKQNLRKIKKIVSKIRSEIDFFYSKMDLFVMNRYWSEEPSENTEKTNEEKLLEKLKAKVASKKKSKNQKDVGSEPVAKKAKVEIEDVSEKAESSEKKIKKEKKTEVEREAETVEAKSKLTTAQPIKTEGNERFVTLLSFKVNYL